MLTLWPAPALTTSGASLAAFAAGMGLGASLIIAIGAQNAYVLRQGLRREHVAQSVAICIGIDVALIALGVGGMGALLGQMPRLLNLIRWAGVLFLLAYGARALHAAWRGAGHLEASAVTPQTAGAAALTVLALSLLNPHVYLDTVVLLGAIGASRGWPDRFWFAVGAMCASTIWFTGLGYGARLLIPIFSRDMAWRVLDLVIGAVMWAIALSLALQAA
jgi:L-lysine exporter family protein LysE/ArgO